MADTNETVRINPAELMQFIARKERLIVNGKDLAEQKKELNTEIKGAGYDIKHVDHVIAQRAMDANDRSNLLAEREVYEEAAGL